MKLLLRIALSLVAALVGLPLLLVFALFLFSNQNDVVPPSGNPLDALAIQNVHVINTETGDLLEDQMVIIRGGVIQSVSESSAAPADTTVIDGNGRYMLPGLWNMHTHVSYPIPGFRLESMPALVAYGVMYARNLNSDCFGITCSLGYSVDQFRALNALVSQGEMLGPELVGLGSYPVNGPPEMGLAMKNQPAYLAPSTAEQGRELARYLKRRGVDFIKPYSGINRDAFFGMMEEAKRLDLEVGGHLPQGVFLSEAIEAGQRSVEHAVQLPLSCSDVEEELRPAIAHFLALNQEQRETLESEQPEDYEYVRSSKAHYRDIINRFNPERCQKLLALWAEADSYYVPTHVTRWAETVMHTFPWRHDLRADYVGDLALATRWNPNAENYIELFGNQPEQEQAFIDHVVHGQTLTGLAHEAGVKVMVGTDTGDTLIYPGASFHDEMLMMVEGGMSAADVLHAATVTAAEYEGMEEEHGSISVGKAANLILLRENPLEDIRNSHSVDAVYYQRRYYNRAELDQVMAGVKSRAKGISHYLRNGWDIVQAAFAYLTL
ncbi:MAG: amidohydrolase family protein [Pseudomonadota bacterium]